MIDQRQSEKPYYLTLKLDRVRILYPSLWWWVAAREIFIFFPPPSSIIVVCCCAVVPSPWHLHPPLILLFSSWGWVVHGFPGTRGPEALGVARCGRFRYYIILYKQKNYPYLLFFFHCCGFSFFVVLFFSCCGWVRYIYI